MTVAGDPTTGIGPRITWFRELSGFDTHQALAKRAGLSRSYITRIELGTAKKPSLDALEKLAGALRVSVGQILGEVPLGECHWKSASLNGHDPLRPTYGTGGVMQVGRDSDTPRSSDEEAAPSESADAQFVLKVSGDSLMIQVTPDGSFVLRQHVPSGASLVVVRLSPDYSFKVFTPEDDATAPSGGTLLVHATPAAHEEIDRPAAD